MSTTMEKIPLRKLLLGAVITVMLALLYLDKFSVTTVLVGLIIFVPFFAGIFYVLSFVFRMVMGERLTDDPASPEAANKEPSAMLTAEHKMQIIGVIIGSAVIAWYFMGRYYVGEPDYYIAATELYQEYERNELVAHAKYHGKVVQVTGKMVGSGVSLGSPWVQLYVGSRLFTVQCMFPASRSSEAATLKKGKNITLKGKISGQTLGSVMIIKCRRV